MPRVSRAEAERNRANIEQVSARLFREQGFHGISVADLMSAAGLTHGGFYGHFESKDALAAIACTRAFEDSLDRWRKRVDGAPDHATALAALMDGYLSTRNRNAMGTGCAIAALATDVAREPDDKPVHEAFVAGLIAQLAVLEELQPAEDAATRRADALAQMSTLVGALVLSRATRGHALSNEILAAARAQLPGADADD